MDLQISVFLLFVLFTAGHSLYCYECMTDYCEDTLVICPRTASTCKSATMVTQIGYYHTEKNVKGCAADCHSGSMNLGPVKSSYSCCHTSFCNTRDAPDPRTLMPNGLICYSCDGSSCSNIMSCSGSEDRCITLTELSEGQTVVVKGCASRSLCDFLSTTEKYSSCCEGHLCNDEVSAIRSSMYDGEESITQSSMYDGEESITQSSMYDGEESVFQSVTEGFVQSVTQSSMHYSNKSVLRSVTEGFIQSITKSSNHKSRKNDKKNFLYDNAKSNKQSSANNEARRVTQSFLILCFLLSVITML
ncbi:uncharacterized protein LOC130214732 [Danio aesculapii]|uniref:uncharacterized protein LOC130214732 n=1 Tax=Danio aesculapii TaxID=1142201 RepID=UPI0024C06EDD|nr:uncharacterized protein LOC130214732 [Danio aesculapii]